MSFGQAAPGYILTVLSCQDCKKDGYSILLFSSKLAKCLAQKLMVIIIKENSLEHYGQIDPLASQSSKEEFVSYVQDLHKQGNITMESWAKTFCPDAKVKVMNNDDFENTLDEMGKEIFFAITKTKKKGLIFKRPPPYVRLLESKGINILGLKQVPLNLTAPFYC